MNIKKIIKGIIGIGAVGGIAYAAYKLGESNGEVNERFRQKYDDDEDEYDFDDDEDGYNLYDEPDDECLAPANCIDAMNTDKKPDDTVYPSETAKFAPLSAVKIEGIKDFLLSPFLLFIANRKYISNKTIRDKLSVDYNKAEEILSVLYDAGYIGGKTGTRITVLIKPVDLLHLIRSEKE